MGAVFYFDNSIARQLMPVFNHRFVVDASLEAVRTFHRDTSILKKLTPPPTFVNVHEFEPLEEGSIARFTLWAGPIPLKWKAIHKNVTNESFTDVQVEGPAKSWAHTHTFERISNEQTAVIDHIEFEHHPGFNGLMTRFLFANMNLKIMFRYRQWVTQRELKKPIS